METEQKTTEEELEELLRNGENAFFLECLYDDYSLQIIHIIAKWSYGRLDENELLDVFQETIIQVWEKLEQGSFAPESPLRLVFTIAKRRAIDSARKNGTRTTHIPSATDVTDLVIDDLKNTQLSVELKLAREEDKDRFGEELPEIVVACLTQKQHVAFFAFADCIDIIRKNDKYGPVVEQIYASTGERLTTASVKSQLTQALTKIRDEAVRRGFNFLEEKEL